MIRRIVLKNFMSHAETVIDLACVDHANDKQGGLTVLIGDNNSGKSAVVAALQTLCYNAGGGDYMVRHGEKECEVTVDTIEDNAAETTSAGGHILTWRRVKKKTSYVINGREIDRVGRKVPDDLHKLLRLPQVAAKGDPFDIHFGEQKQPIFLLNETSSRRATFFASSSDTCKLIEMQELHRGKVRAAKQDHKAILQRKELLEQRLVTLQPIDELEQRLSDCESLFETIGSQKKAAEKIAILIEALSAARGKCKFLEKQSLTLQQITSPPLLQPTSPLAKLIHLLASTQHQKQFENAKANALSECRTAPRLLNTSALEKLISQLQTSHTEIALQQQVCNAINPLTSPPKIKNQESIKRSATIVESITSAFDKLQRAKRMIVKLNVALEETNIELGHRIDELGDCPTCGQEIDPEKLIARARLGNDFKLRQQSLPLNSSETFPSEVQP